MVDKIIVKGVVYDPVMKQTIPGSIVIKKGVIESIERDENVVGPIILPGFVDSHIHIESSMLLPTEFSRIAVQHGTVAVVADPHEIANAAGVDGIDFMIENAKLAEIKFYFGAPSCVPASPFDDCYQVIDASEIAKLMVRDDIHFLGEMMNFPGVIYDNEDVHNKIKSALKNNKPVDGHAPGLKDESLRKYVKSGISTDHECFTEEEAQEKLKLGMKVLIREGSAAKNYNTLHSLISKSPESVMLCTDDCHPEDLIKGHINIQFKRSLDNGHNIFDVLQVTSVNPVKHYKLKVGLLQKGDSADFIVVNNLNDFKIVATYINGINVIEPKIVNRKIDQYVPGYSFLATMNTERLAVKANTANIRVIDAIDGELVTKSIKHKAKIVNGLVVSDIENDILKIVVINRYKKDISSVGFIKGFGLKKGAIAESIAHDSHHLIAVGVDDESILKAIDFIVTNKGGVCYNNGVETFGLALPVYGLMGVEPAKQMAEKYELINKKVAADGCFLKAPFMTLSFMALSVIPELKMTPNGLFDVVKFQPTELFV